VQDERWVDVAGAAPVSRIVMSDREIVSTLNELIDVSRDGEKGFARAAQDSKDPALIKVFGDSARSCREAAEELQDEVRMLGGRSEEGGSMRAAGHRGWPNLKNVMSNRDNRVLLEECEKAEDYAESRYAEAMKLTWPASLRAVIERQYQAVVANHDRVRDLRNRYRA
jgi:uncharacterized protein (TIGR02284 family)